MHACPSRVVGESLCVLCAVEISSDNKSPVPKCCFECYEQQSAVEDALTAEQMDPQADDAKFAETKTPPPAFEKDTPASEKELLTEVACPELGWAKRKRESEMSWYARIQAFRHGSEKKKQKFYHEQWSGFDQKHSQIVSRTTSVCSKADKRKGCRF